MSPTAKKLIAVLLTLNLLLIGMMGGQFLQRGFKDRQAMPAHPEEILALPEDKQAIYENAMADVRKKNKMLRKDIASKRQAVVAALTADRFDADAYQDAVEALHDIRGKHMQYLADATKEMAEQFSLRERILLAQMLRKQPRGGKNREGHRPPPHHRGGQGPRGQEGGHRSPPPF